MLNYMTKSLSDFKHITIHWFSNVLTKKRAVLKKLLSIIINIKI